jgi:hypothetical protein
MVIVSRAMTEHELYQIGGTPDKVVFASQEHAFINTPLFVN